MPDNFKNYFVIEFDKPFTYKATVADSCISVGKAEQEANHAGAIIGFATRKVKGTRQSGFFFHQSGTGFRKSEGVG